jgi:ribosomal protein L35
MTVNTDVWKAMQMDKEVQGVASYLEFRRSDSTIQIVIIPDAMTTTGKLTRASMFRRQITTHSPRKQWRNTYFNMNFDKSDADVLSKDESDIATMTRLGVIEDYIVRIADYGFTLYKKPLFAEISKHDADSIVIGKLPSKLMYRISQLRSVNGFDENLIGL